MDVSVIASLQVLALLFCWAELYNIRRAVQRAADAIEEDTES